MSTTEQDKGVSSTMAVNDEIITDRELDGLRYRYEFGDESLKDLCHTYGLLISELSAYAESRNWTKHEEPNIEDNKAVNNYCATAKRQVAIQLAKRALILWHTISELEDDILNKAKLSLLALDEGSMATPLELTRIMSIVQSIQSTYHTPKESLVLPALILGDKDKGDLETLLKARGLPIPSFGVPDIDAMSEDATDGDDGATDEEEDTGELE